MKAQDERYVLTNFGDDPIGHCPEKSLRSIYLGQIIIQQQQQQQQQQHNIKI